MFSVEDLDYCVYEKKYSYTRKQADRTMAQFYKRPLRKYKCDKCKGWHLTSQPYDPKRGRK